jgi:hypothetical protein
MGPPAVVGLPFWPALEGSQVDRSVAPAAYFIARINHERKSLFLLDGRFLLIVRYPLLQLAHLNFTHKFKHTI